MKKLLTAIVAVLYLGLSSGFAIDVHYCMGKVVSVNLETKKSGKCGRCGMTAKKGCCQDQLTVLKINDSHKANYTSYSFQPGLYILSNNYSSLQFIPALNSIQQPEINSFPPENTYPSFYILYNVFRI